MKHLKHVLVSLLILCSVFSQSLHAADNNGQKLFVNLTSDELNRATMAISFSTRIRKEKNIPVTLYLNVGGVRIADKNILGHKHANGKTLKEMLATFIDAGGRIIICPMCMKNVGGLSKADLIHGVEIGGSKVTWPALFAQGTTVLNY